jgi:hypothetical protein
VPLFRKRETYNEQMLREAGLDRVRFRDPAPTPPPTLASVNLAALTLHGRLGPKEWDAVTTVVAPGIAGDRVEFTVLPEGDLIVETEEGDGDLSPLADAIEERIAPPYRAAGSRQEGDLWVVGAKAIGVATFPFPEADALQLSQSDGVAELRVDGEPSDAAPPVELQRLGEAAGADYSVEATRIDGDSWEVRVSPL